MKMNNIIACVFLLVALLSTACEDLLTKVIDVDLADYPPKLSVTAVLDTDRSFKIRLSEAKSLASFNDWSVLNESVQRHVSVKLYEDDRCIFDDSRLSYFGGITSVILDTVVLEMQQGSVYKLTVEMDGYQTVASSATMPVSPILGQVSIDTVNIIKKTNPAVFESLSSGYSSYWGSEGEQFYGIKMSLTDNSPQPDYYSLELRTTNLSPEQTTETGHPVYFPEYNIGVSNTVLVQDNPDVEAAGLLSDGESFGLYLFDLMLFSDISFANKTINLDLFMPAFNNRMRKEKIPDYDPEFHGAEIILHVKHNLLVKHITTETFRHYRTLALQNQGLGFFSEPVTITTNIENGLGCFSLCNSQQVELFERLYYYYPQYYYWY